MTLAYSLPMLRCIHCIWVCLQGFWSGQGVKNENYCKGWTTSSSSLIHQPEIFNTKLNSTEGTHKRTPCSNWASLHQTTCLCWKMLLHKPAVSGWSGKHAVWHTPVPDPIKKTARHSVLPSGLALTMSAHTNRNKTIMTFTVHFLFGTAETSADAVNVSLPDTHAY